MTPDAFLNDWYGYATNQMGHFTIGLAAFILAVWLFGGIRKSVAVTMLIYALWEVTQMARGAMLWDSVEDFGFVFFGVIFAAGAWAVKREAMTLSMVIAIIVLVNGIVGRKK